MKKGIICILVCTLLIAAILPITAMAGNEQNPMEKSDTEPFQQHQSIENATLEFRFNQRGFTIINIGNVTALDIWWNITSDGGLLWIGNRHINGTLAQLVPDEPMTAKLGFMLGFGKMTFHIQAGATNVPTLEKDMTGTLVLFLILWFLN
jgi:hypothetical protein